MATEGLVRALSTEREGKFPARTVYEITDEGVRELRVLQHETDHLRGELNIDALTGERRRAALRMLRETQSGVHRDLDDVGAYWRHRVQ